MVDISFMVLICVGCAIIIIISVWSALEYMERKEAKQCSDYIALNEDIKKGVDEILKEQKEWADLALEIHEQLNLTLINETEKEIFKNVKN